MLCGIAIYDASLMRGVYEITHDWELGNRKKVAVNGVLCRLESIAQEASCAQK